MQISDEHSSHSCPQESVFTEDTRTQQRDDIYKSSFCSEGFVTSEFPGKIQKSPWKTNSLHVRLHGCQNPFVLNSWHSVDFIKMETIHQLFDVSILFGLLDSAQCPCRAAGQQVSGGRLVQQISVRFMLDFEFWHKPFI